MAVGRGLACSSGGGAYFDHSFFSITKENTAVPESDEGLPKAKCQISSGCLRMQVVCQQ
jgi:hypothetical protein